MLSEKASPLPSPAPQSDEEYEESSDSESLNSDYDETPVKKQKMNEIDLWDGHLSSGDEEVDLMDPNFCDDDDKVGDLDSWERYFDQINESEGFDVKENPGSGPFATIFPRPYYLEYPENVRKLEDYAAKALEEYNEKHLCSNLTSCLSSCSFSLFSLER